MIENPHRHDRLALQRNLFNRVARDERHRVCVALESDARHARRRWRQSSPRLCASASRVRDRAPRAFPRQSPPGAAARPDLRELRAPRSARISLVLVSVRSSDSPFAIFRDAGVAGVKSATAAAMTTMSASPARTSPRDACRTRSGRSRIRARAAAGAPSVHSISVTRAPRRAASAASA